MSALPKHLIGSIIAFVVIGLLGGGAWFWTSGQLDAALAERTTVDEQLRSVEAKGYFPSSQNLKIIENNQVAVSALAADLLPQLDRATAKFAAFLAPDMKGLPQEAWKEKLVSTREELKKSADSHKINTAEDFYFGFKRYRVASPPAGSTRDIGIQLAAIYEISGFLIKAGVSEIKEIRRVMVEDTGVSPQAGGEESLAASVVEGTGGLYKVYPFEIKFQSSPSALNKFVNELGRSPMIFITRFMVVENEKSTVPRRSEFTSSVATPEGGDAKLLIPIVGQEKVNTRMRIDLIFWNGVSAEKKPAAPAKPKTGQP